MLASAKTRRSPAVSDAVQGVRHELNIHIGLKLARPVPDAVIDNSYRRFDPQFHHMGTALVAMRLSASSWPMKTAISDRLP